MTVISHILGFPRIGENRELKIALEKYWRSEISQKQLFQIGYDLRTRHWKKQKNFGIDLISVGDFAWYDHVLTTSLMVDNIPERHRLNQKEVDINTLFRISRGHHNAKDKESIIIPSEMKKWFNTNYHYIVPEFTKNQEFKFNWTQLLDEIDEALTLKYKIKATILGPISYLWLGKIKGKKFDRLSLLPSLLSVYQKILQKISKKNVDWIQIDEPILVLELPVKWKQIYFEAYKTLHGKIKLLLTTYFDDIYHHIDIIKELPVDGLHIDLTSNKKNDISFLHKTIPSHWILSAGIINGRNIWKTDLYYWFKKLYTLKKYRKIWIGSSCSLLHVPIDLCLEEKLPKKIKNLLSFASQKCFEIKILSDALNYNELSNSETLIQHYIENRKRFHLDNEKHLNKKNDSNNINYIHHHNHKFDNSIHNTELKNKKLKFPLFPTTTIGSFPQTKEIRNLRLKFKTNKIDKKIYIKNIKNIIKKNIEEQEKLNLDVLVHGEPERNDMVEYFGENLEGFLFTNHGWIQSYGSRCVKPPIIIDDIQRLKPITVEWINYAQSLTNKPVKGILTGPITIMLWSFLREDISKNKIALQLALTIQNEITDLENSGIKIIQIDEPALREGLPLKISKQKKYLDWAIKNFKTTTAHIKNTTHIHTHMCYSELNDIMDAIIALNVDVITIESSRSNTNIFKKMENSIKKLNGIGPGIYDIHSPNEPNTNDFISRLNQLLHYIPIKKLWINPDCGLKTRSWPEIKNSLNNMVLAAKMLRKKFL